MALRLRELHPEREFEFVITPTGDESDEMLEHWRRLMVILGPLVPLTCGLSLQGLIEKHRMLPNWRARWCTRQLKIEPYEAFLIRSAPAVSYVGLRADEEVRGGMEFRGDIPEVELTFPMRDWGWRMGDVLSYLDERGIVIPPRTDCMSCFFQTLGEWYELWRTDRPLYLDYEQNESTISRERDRQCTYRSDGRDSWPAPLSALRAEFEAGRRPRGVDQPDLFGQARCRVCSM